MYSDSSGAQYYTGRRNNYIPHQSFDNHSFTDNKTEHSIYSSRHGDMQRSFSENNTISTMPVIPGSSVTTTTNPTSDSSSVEEKVPWSFRKVLTRFAERTSMQGIPYIHVSKTWYAKLAWTLIFIVSSVAMVGHLYYLCDIYMAFPKKITVELGYDTLPFPAVTICNVNPIRKNQTHMANNQLRDLLESMQPSRVIDIYNPPPPTNSRSPRRGPGNSPDPFGPLFSPQVQSPNGMPVPELLQDGPAGFLDKISRNFSSFRPDIEYGRDEWESIGREDQADAIYRDFVRLFNAETREKRISMGHDLKDMLIKCSFAGRVCHPENFTLSTDSNLGNCFTLQSPLFQSHRSGPAAGLELILFMENHEYIRGITNSNGAQVQVHEVGTVPHPFDDGIAVSSSQETLLGLQLNRLTRMDQPFGYCTGDQEHLEKYGVKYTRRSCEDLCEANLVIDACNCTDASHDETNLRIRRNRDLPHFCRSRDEIRCLSMTNRQYEKGLLKCDCEDECNENIYTQSLSSRQWPSTDYAKLLLEILCAKKGQAECTKAPQNDSRELALNFVKLNIYFESLNYKNTSEEQDYDDVQFVSDIGGTLGLWIGLSALSIMEVVQLLLELLSYIWCRRTYVPVDKRRRSREQREEKEVPARIIDPTFNIKFQY